MAESVVASAEQAQLAFRQLRTGPIKKVHRCPTSAICTALEGSGARIASRKMLSCVTHFAKIDGACLALFTRLTTRGSKSYVRK